MHVAALGTSPLKGAAQHHPAVLALAPHGPVADRRFCCVDPVARRVLRTVENPALLALRVELGPGPGGARPERLTVHVPGAGAVTGPLPPARTGTGPGTAQPDGPDAPDGPGLRADYWGRRPWLRVLDGPWARALSAHLGREVVLAEAAPRDVVYAGGVTVVTTSSLREVLRRAGRDLPTPALLTDAERWRANVVVDTGDAAAFTEDGWLGRDLRLGSAVVRVRAGVPRCAVVRLEPGSGARGRDLLALLAGDRRDGRDILFGVDAEVLVPGPVAVGDACGVQDPAGRLQP